MATEVEIIKYEGDISDLKKGLKELEDRFKSVENKGKKSAENIKGDFKNLGSSIKNALSSLPIGGLVNDLDNAASAAKGVSTSLSAIPAAADKGTKSVNLLGNAIKIGVLGALALVIVAFSAVVSFFKQTDEGATKLQAVMDGLGAASDVITGRLSAFGSQIVDSFTQATSGAGSFLGKMLEVGKFLPGFVGDIARLASDIGGSGLAKDMKTAYNEANALSQSLDEIQDSMRGLGVETRQTELAITALLKQTRNRGLDIGDRLKIVDQAFQLENQSLAKNFDLQNKYYENLAQVNLLKLKSINSDKIAQVNTVKSIVDQIKYAKNADEILVLYQKQIKAQEGLKSISDDAAQAQANAATSLIELAGKAEIAEEKFAAIRSQLIEKDIAERVEAIKRIERAREAVAINTISNEQELAKETLDIQITSLEDQKKVLLSYKKDVSAIDLEIAKLRQKFAEDEVKRAKEAADAKAKNDKDNAERYNILVDAENALEVQRSNFALKNAEYELAQNKGNLNERLALIQKIQQAELKRAGDEHDIALKNKNLTTDERTRIEEKYAQDIIDINRKAQGSINAENQKSVDIQKQQRQQLADFSIQTAGQVINEIYNRQTTNRNQEIQDAEDESQRKINALQREKDQGVITQAQYNARLARINADKDNKEKEIKRKQAIADKQQALFSILINTAVAVVKSLPNPFLVALSIATGAVEAALVASRPLPKFAKGVIGLQGAGTKTSDSITARLSKGESVMTADETDRHKDTLWAIRNNQFDRHVNEAWVLPAIKKLEKQRTHRESFRDRSMNRLGKRMKDIDLQHLERLTANNKDVRIGNVNELADAIYKRKGHTGII